MNRTTKQNKQKTKGDQTTNIFEGNFCARGGFVSGSPASLRLARPLGPNRGPLRGGPREHIAPEFRSTGYSSLSLSHALASVLPTDVIGKLE